MPKKLVGGKYSINLLIPFPEEIAGPIKRLAHSNGMPVTTVARLLVMKGLDSVRGGEALVLRGLEEVTK